MGDSGTWSVSTIVAAIGSPTLEACAAYCLSHCLRCAFVSFHRRNDDCSWYTRCDTLLWQFKGQEYRTLQVRPVFASPPPPPPQWETPVGARVGYCALMGPDEGDCDNGEQGSWPLVVSPSQCIAQCASCSRCHYISISTSPVLPRNQARMGQGLGVPPLPHWWRCRWYTSCDMDDLRQTPPSHSAFVSLEAPPPLHTAPIALTTSPAAGLVTLSSPSHAPPVTSTTTSTTTGRSALRVAIATVFGVSSKWRKTGGGDPTCALLQWCQNVRRLEAALPPMWDVRRLVLTRSSAARLERLHGCDIERVQIDDAFDGACRCQMPRKPSLVYTHPVPRNPMVWYALTLTPIPRSTPPNGMACAPTSDAGLARACVRTLTPHDSRPLQPGVSYTLHASHFFKRVNLWKWVLLSLRRFDVILYADADLEVMPLAEQPPDSIGVAWREAMRALVSSDHVQLVGGPDPIAPLNGGLLLLKPSLRLYHLGISLLSQCSFNTTHGWELRGPPTSLDARPHLLRHMLGKHMAQRRQTAHLSDRLTAMWRTKAFLRDDWTFDGADTDQGLFFYVFFVRCGCGAYGRLSGGTLRHVPTARHWWATFKPWQGNIFSVAAWSHAPAAERHTHAMLAQGASADPHYLARVYDYVVREAEPSSPPSTRLRGPNVSSQPAAELSRCASSHRRVRRAIEQHVHFREIFGLWQEHQWRGEYGYAGRQPLPLLEMEV